MNVYEVVFRNRLRPALSAPTRQHVQAADETDAERIVESQQGPDCRIESATFRRPCTLEEDVAFLRREGVPADEIEALIASRGEG